jgi:hypothetical protein
MRGSLPVTLSNDGRTLTRNRTVTGFAYHDAISQLSPTAELAFQIMMIFDVPCGKFCMTFLTFTLRPDPGENLCALAKLVSHNRVGLELKMTQTHPAIASANTI